MEASPGQKKATGETLVDLGNLYQDVKKDDQGGFVSDFMSFVKHLGKVLKTPFVFSAPPSEVAEVAKKVNERLYGKDGLGGILDDPANADVLGKRPPIIGPLQTQFGQAEQTRSPLILDLDGLNGADTLDKTAGIHFDHDGNKFAEQTGWVGQNDGLLVWDKNGNGQIDNGTELFGNNTVLNNGGKAANGFAALAELDANKDGKVDASDAASSQLRVFRDANSNGVVDAGELLSLAEAGVQSLNTGYTSQAVTDANGNQHLQTGSFTTTTGQSRVMDDVWFAVDTARTIDTELVAVNDAIAALPDIEGFGNVHSLHQAMARDASGKLQALVQQYAGTGDPAMRASLLNDIIYRWAGVQDIDPASRAATQIYGNVIGDARKLATLETFLGESYLGTWCWGARDPNPHGQAAPILLNAYDQLAQWVGNQLLAQTLFRPLYESIGLRFTPDNQSLEWDVSAVVATLRAQYDANAAQGLAMFISFATNLKTMEEAGTQILAKLRQQGNVQGQGFDLYLAVLGDNLLTGTAGADTLSARAEVDNLFSAGKGADTLNGGSGADTFIWAKGDGNDIISEVGGTSTVVDTLNLLDVNASEARLSRDATNLYVTIGAEQIKVADHFGNASTVLEQIQFSDGRTWGKTELEAAPLLYLGTTSDDALTGTSQSDAFEGGKGADTLWGGAGGDSYAWAKGDGNDVISDYDSLASKNVDTLKLADVAREDVQLSRDPAHLYVTILSAGEKIQVFDHFGGNGAGLERIEFSSGNPPLLLADLNAAPYRGTTGKDTLSGTVAAETFIGGKGVDTLWGGAGSDSYVWIKGDGNDIISDYDSVASKNIDTLKLADVLREDVQLSRDTAHLYVTIVSTGEKIQVFDHFTGNGAGLERIEFPSGNPLLLADLNAAAYRGTAGKDTLSGTSAAETFVGGKGIDLLWGGAGGDSYVWVKGDGNDIISDYDSVASKNIDTLKLIDVAREDVQLSRDTAHLYVTIVSTGEKIQVFDHFSGNGAGLERIEFSSGNPLLLADLNAAVFRGTGGADTITGTNGNDVLDGQAGNDVLAGGVGSDVYQMGRGYGTDTIQENDAKAGNTDVLQFMAGINADQLWFRKASNNLEVSVIGTADKAVVKDWYLGNQCHVEQIKSGDGKLLLDTQVQKLVQAMAAFTPPAMGQTSLTAAQQTALAPVLAASWH